MATLETTDSIRLDVIAALKTVYDPDLKQDLVALGMIQGLEIADAGNGLKNVKFTVMLTTPACPVKEQLKSECFEKVKAVSGIQNVEVIMSAQVKNANANPNGGEKGIPGVAQIIAVSSGKGGVGKSTVAVGIATALAKLGAKVGIMDADIYGPNVPTMMGVVEQPKLFQDPVRGELFIPPVANGVKVMSMGFLVQGDQPLVWRGPMLHSIVSQFCFKVDWGQLDYLIIDMPPGTGDVQLSLAQLVPLSGAVLVTTPQEVSLQDVRKAYYMFEKVRVPVLGVVENMSYFKCGKCDEKHHLFGKDGGKLLAKKFQIDFLAELPLDPRIRDGGDMGKPAVLSMPELKVSEEILSLAKKVAQKVAVMSAQGGGVSPQVEIGQF